VGHVRHAQRLVDRHPAALVVRQSELGGERVGRDADGPNNRRGLDPPSVEEHGGGRLAAGERRLGENLDAALAPRSRGQAREPIGRLSEDEGRGVDEDPLRCTVASPECGRSETGRRFLDIGAPLDPGEHEAQAARCAVRG
jgi:hypothetical protein